MPYRVLLLIPKASTFYHINDEYLIIISLLLVVAPLAEALASLGLYVGITGFEATVDLIWMNAISAAAQTDDHEAGLVAIHIICWGAAKGVSAVGLRLSSLGKICFISPPVCQTIMSHVVI